MKKTPSIALAVSLLYGASSQFCLASGPRDTYNYELKQGSTVVYRGQTADLKRREAEHARDGKKFTHMHQVGRAKTEEGARRAEKAALATYRRSHGGKNPKYNQTNHG